MRKVFFYVSFFLIVFTQENNIEKCNITPFEVSITKCDLNFQRNVIISNPNNCNLTQDYAIKSQEKIPCQSCPAGAFLNYNNKTKSLLCTKCPKNTFSTGNTIQIRGKYNEWNQKNIQKYFETVCFVAKGSKETKDCTSHSSNLLTISTGNPTNNETGVIYVSQLSLSVELIQQGTLYFRYKKNAITERGRVNGIFRLYLDYLIEVNDVEPNLHNEWKEVKFNVGKGKHSFLFQYLKNMNTESSKDLFLFLDDLKVDGVETASTFCEECEDGVAEEGSDHCTPCSKTEYYDKDNKKCIKCPKGTYSDGLGNSSESCVKFPACNDSDYYYIIENMCNNVTKKQKQSFFLANKNCIETSKKKTVEIPCQTCQKGNYWKNLSNNKQNMRCEPCPEGTYTKADNSNNCILCEGITKKVSYFNAVNQSSFSTNNIELTANGEMRVLYEVLNSKENKIFQIKIDSIPVTFKDKTTYISVIVFKGSHQISLSSENVRITQIIIDNTKNGVGIQCNKCPLKQMIAIEDGVKVCKECGPGMSYSIVNKNCEKCPKGYYKSSYNSTDKCLKCPMFTYSSEDGSQCIPYDVLTQGLFMQKYPLRNIRIIQDTLCKISDNLCHDKIYGPIRDDEKNLYFISFDYATLFHSKDFTYTISSGKQYPTYISRLERDKTNNKNIKLYKSLGADIESIKLIHSDASRGILMHYINGDVCDSENHRYHSYLHLKCKKHNEDTYIYNSPRLIKKEGCVIYFEWENPGACPICLADEAERIPIACRNGERTVYFSEKENCVIQNTSNFIGDNIEYLEEGLIFNGNEEAVISDVFSIPKMTSFNLTNEDNYFLSSNRYIEKCSVLEDYDTHVLYLLLLIPIVYVIVVLACIYYFYRYRKISKEYKILLQDSNATIQQIDNKSLNQNVLLKLNENVDKNDSNRYLQTNDGAQKTENSEEEEKKKDENINNSEKGEEVKIKLKNQEEPTKKELNPIKIKSKGGFVQLEEEGIVNTDMGVVKTEVPLNRKEVIKEKNEEALPEKEE